MADETEKIDPSEFKIPPEVVAKRQIVTRSAESSPVYYANFAGLMGTQWDVCIKFGQIEEADDTRMQVNQVATVYLSPQHARAVRDLLVRKIAQYEQIYPAWRPVDGEAKAE